jgi:hypothetical protein
MRVAHVGGDAAARSADSLAGTPVFGVSVRQRLSAAIVGGALGSVPRCLYPPQAPQAAACSGRAQRAEHQHADSDCAGSAVSAWQAARSGSGVLASLPPRGLAVQCSAKGVAGMLSKP